MDPRGTTRELVLSGRTLADHEILFNRRAGLSGHIACWPPHPPKPTVTVESERRRHHPD